MQRDIHIERPDRALIKAQYHQPTEYYHDTSAPLVIFVPDYPQTTTPSSKALQNEVQELLPSLGLSYLTFSHAPVSSNADTNKDSGAEPAFSFDSARQDMAAITAWAKKNNHSHLSYYAEGLGAASTLFSLQPEAKFCIFQAPILDLSYFREHQTPIENTGTANNAPKYKNTTLHETFIKELHTVNLAPYLRQAHTPTLILFGEQDRHCPQAHIDLARQSLMVPWLDIIALQDATHELDDNYKQAGMHHIESFVRKNLKFVNRAA